MTNGNDFVEWYEKQDEDDLRLAFFESEYYEKAFDAWLEKQWELSMQEDTAYDQWRDEQVSKSETEVSKNETKE